MQYQKRKLWMGFPFPHDRKSRAFMTTHIVYIYRRVDLLKNQNLLDIEASYKMKIQEAVQLFCLFAMLAKANGRQCYVCYEENGAITEGNCAYRNITTCEGNESYCFKLLRFTDADELFSKRKGCAKKCVNDVSTEPPSTGLKERHLSCCTGNLCNTDKNVTATTVTRNTTQTSQPTPTDSATINGSSLIFVTLMAWSWNLYWIM